MPEQLRDQGLSVDVVPAYRTVTAQADGEALKASLEAGAFQWVTFTSSSTVTNLLKLLGAEGPALLKKTKIACIGPITAETCLEHGIEPDVMAGEYTIKGLAEAILTFYGEEM